MQYNGKVLIELTPENWDGKSREMLVWCNAGIGHIKTVIGYNPRRCAWVVDDKTLVYWPHCAEIPTEESNQEQKEPNQVQSTDEMIEILNAYNEGKIIEYRFRREICAEYRCRRPICDSWCYINPQKPEWNWDIFEYRIKPEPAATANEEINTKIKSRRKPRRMTNRELADLLATGNVEKCYQYYVDGHDLSKVYRSHSYYRNKEDSPCAKSILIRYHGTNEWVKPLIVE